MCKCGARSVAALTMHHIYCESKKDYIIAAAASKEGMRGVYRFGKPGRVVVEGPGQTAVQYAKKVKQLKWQKCQVAFVGEYPSNDDAGNPFPFYLPRPNMVEVVTEQELQEMLHACGLKCVYDALSSNWGASTGASHCMPPPSLTLE